MRLGSGGLGKRLQGDVVAKCLELGDESFGDAFRVAFAEVIAAEVVVELAGCEHVPAGDQDRVFDSAEGFLVPAAGSQAGVLRGEVHVLGADRGHR